MTVIFTGKYESTEICYTIASILIRSCFWHDVVNNTEFYLDNMVLYGEMYTFFVITKGFTIDGDRSDSVESNKKPLFTGKRIKYIL